MAEANDHSLTVLCAGAASKPLMTDGGQSCRDDSSSSGFNKLLLLSVRHLQS